MAIAHSLACLIKSVMVKATLDRSVGKQEAWSEKVREHCDRKERHELGSPEYGVGALRRGSARLGMVTSG